MPRSADFVIESQTMIILRDHNRDLREEAFANLSTAITVPFRKTKAAGAFGAKKLVRILNRQLNVTK